ncbi:unnamed protein product [Caenorhabditis angaria]|uniref:MD domain-containing protein n=1 Tax=Caenorhabditis angaria TaxID=860376 RepID=A0A9P1J4K2_9PELO|nr:unnamed protein product [Caenorhabditis angaria]
MLKLALFLTLFGLRLGLNWDTQDFANRLNEKTKLFHDLGLPNVGDRFNPIFPEKQQLKTQTKSEQLDNVPCPPGFSGINCSIATCYNRSYPILAHDGTAEFGDLVESDYSATCSDTFTFYIDNAIPKFYVVLNTFDATNPKGTIYDSYGTEVQSCGDFSFSKTQTIHLICDPPKGVYTVKLSADANKPCIFEIRAPTNLTIDGGFISDQRDDDVQQIILETANQGIFRYPTEFVKSWFAFKVEHEEFPAHPEEVHIYMNGLYDQTFGLNLRYGCDAPHITSTPYNCSSSNVYHVKVRGYDSDGNRFQRIYDFYCEPPENVSPTQNPVSTTPPSFCQNGGILYDSPKILKGQSFHSTIEN